ncbi:MAG: CRISPR-associated helicase Cas3' [Candidatus Schekmanbacteria bacterium]|nr:CRISPR-associated helicase Cas3' [Candidatus Schekmanbacteria bacterium]
MENFFEKFTEFKPYELQKETANKLLENKNVVLTAPTGAGKTYAALVPFLWSKLNGKPIADRLIYALPLRTLATSLYDSTVKTYDKFNENNSTGLKITIQTGEQKEDPFFEGDIIFTTIDQLLSGYLNIPVSLPARVSNINAGALIGAMVVFDEFHLLDPEKAMGTAIEMMDRLKHHTRFLIMTATMPEKSCKWLEEKINAEWIMVEEKEVIAIQENFKEKGKQVRNWEWTRDALSAEYIIKAHQKRSIVLCNTVRRAQSIYRDLETAIKKNGDKAEIILLHSRFFPDDRKMKEEKVIEIFGKDAQNKNVNVILVTTQVIEAGIDISAENLHTEIAPMNSLIQRAGRSARYGGEGRVWVYELEAPQNTRPYTSELVELTRHEFENKPVAVLNFLEEQALVNKVHTEIENNALSIYDNLNNVRKKVCAAFEYGDLHNLADLIREINNINVLITDNPESVRFDKAKWPLTLSVPRDSLWQLKEYFEASNNDSNWIVKRPESSDDDEMGLHFKWTVINDIKKAVDAPWLIAIHPNYACYSKEIGLELRRAGIPQKIDYRDRPQITAYHYYCETWLDHIQQLIAQCDELLAKSICSIKHIAAVYNLSENQLKDMARLACTLHDTGKLSTCWQNAVKNWQADNYPNDPQYLKNEPLAHTTYNPENDWEKARYNKGPHAVEGAFAIANCIYCYYNNNTDSKMITRLIISAIARHHGGRVAELSDYKLITDAEAWIKRALNKINLQMETKCLSDKPGIGHRETFKNALITFTNPDWEKWIPLYFWLVRLVRMADQKGTAMHTGGIEQNVR